MAKKTEALPEKTSYLSKEDGLINVTGLQALAKEVQEYAEQEGSKLLCIHYSAKFIPKYDASKAEKQGDRFARMRTQIIKSRKKLPPAGSSIRFSEVFREYKGMEEADCYKAYRRALKAIAQHTVAAQEILDENKAAYLKNKMSTGKTMNKCLEILSDILVRAKTPDGKTLRLASATSDAGLKSMMVHIPNLGYVTIGKSTKERFEKMKNPAPSKEEEAASSARSKRK